MADPILLSLPISALFSSSLLRSVTRKLVENSRLNRKKVDVYQI